jgi:hypothetical protein
LIDLNESKAREAEVIALLEEWPWDSGSTLVGGYALAAYGKARYSEDIDFTVPSEGSAALKSGLSERGFESIKRSRPPSSRAFQGANRLSRDAVTIDLLVGFVRDREALVEIPEKWISNRYREVRLDLLTGGVNTPARVARPEALWALKLQAGRDQDITDLFTERP